MNSEDLVNELDLEMVAIDLLGPVEKTEENGRQLYWKCPRMDHSDSDPSFTLNRDEGVFYCHGCDWQGNVFDLWNFRRGGDFKSALKELEEEYIGNGREPGITLEEYARIKNLDREFLQELGLQDTKYKDRNAIAIPYCNEGGSLVRTRFRINRFKTDNNGRFRWDNAEQKPPLYGLWQTHDWEGRLILVEGESDCHTLWQNGFQALGLPGVKFATDRIRDFEDTLNKFDPIYVIRERGVEGDFSTLREIVDSHVEVVDLPTDDVNDLWKIKDNFKVRLEHELANNYFARKQLINLAIKDVEVALDLVSELERGVFPDTLGEIFQAIKDILHSGREYNKLSIAEEIGDMDRIMGLFHRWEDLPSLEGHYEDYIEALKSEDRKRKIEESEIIDPSCDFTIQEYKKEMNNILSSIKEEDYQELTGEDFAQIYREMQEDPDLGMVHWGFPALDEKIGKLPDTALVCLQGFVSSGKSMFAINMMANHLQRDLKVGFISLEMTLPPTAQRLGQLLMELDQEQFRYWIQNQDIGDLVEEVKSYPILFNHYSSWPQTQNKIREWVMGQKVDVIYLDYIQRIAQGVENKHTVISNMMNDLETLTGEYHIPIIALSQVNRDSSRKGKINMFSGKESGGIEESADILIGLEPASEEDYHNDADPLDIFVNVIKNRLTGRTGNLLASFHKDTQTVKSKG